VLHLYSRPYAPCLQSYGQGQHIQRYDEMLVLIQIENAEYVHIQQWQADTRIPDMGYLRFRHECFGDSLSFCSCENPADDRYIRPQGKVFIPAVFPTNNPTKD
jgi:hypothetical protein